MTDTQNIAALLGQRGGQKTKEKYGTDHYKKMAQKSAEARRKKASGSLSTGNAKQDLTS